MTNQQERIERCIWAGGRRGIDAALGAWGWLGRVVGGLDPWVGTGVLLILLGAGASAFRAQAADGWADRLSAGNVGLTRVLIAPMTVGIEGKGTVSPNYNGKDIEVGKTYTMTAKPGAGFKFVEWTDGAGHGVTNKPAVKFAMQAGLVLVAKFADGQKPVVTIGAPASGARVTAPGVTVTGKATDNGEVAAVKCQVNDGPWVEAQGTGAWQVGVTLVAGPNAIRVQAVDKAGNVSAVVVRSVTYVVVGRMTVKIEGKGTVSPNCNGKDLEVGKTYTMTAKPGAGFKFVEWTDGAGHGVTNKAAVKFVMQAGSVLVAHFVDGQKPVVTISAPASGARVTAPGVTVTGKATDNGEVAAVKYQVNDGPWVEAQGAGVWQAGVTLVAGPNVIRVQAVDKAGNVSAVAVRSVTYVVVGRMTVKIEGKGTASPNYDGKDLEVGKTYTMTAKPGAGFKFVEWTDGAGHGVTNKAAVKFVMQAGLVLVAKFVDGQKPVVKVTAPKPGQIVNSAGELFMVTGTATDNVGVVGIWVKVNDGEWVKAEGTTAWQLEVTLAVGSNTVRVYGRDAAGNESAAVAVKFRHAPNDDKDIRAVVAALKTRAQAHDVAGFTALFAGDYVHNGRNLSRLAQHLAEQLQAVKTFDFKIARLEIGGERAQAHGTCKVTYNDGSPVEEWTEPNAEGDSSPGFGWLKKTARGWRVCGNEVRTTVRIETGHNSDWGTHYFWLSAESGVDVESIMCTGPGLEGIIVTPRAEPGGFLTYVDAPAPAPAVGTVYAFEIAYGDGSRETRSAEVRSYVPTAPTITVTTAGASATIRWNDVSQWVPGAKAYGVTVYGLDDDVYWEIGDLALTRTSVLFNEDGAAQGVLHAGHTYSVQVFIVDEYGDSAYRAVEFSMPGPAGLASVGAANDWLAVEGGDRGGRQDQIDGLMPRALVPAAVAAATPVGAEAVGMAGRGAQFAGVAGALVVTDGRFGMTVEGTPGVSVVIERSGDLRHWVPVQTAVLDGAVVRLEVPASREAGGHFFRLRVE